MRVHGVVEDELALQCSGVRIEQQLVRVPAAAARRVPGPVNPEAVALAGLDAGQVAVPDVEGGFGQRDPALATGVVEKAQLDALGPGRPEREVDALSVVASAERMPVTRPGPVPVLSVVRIASLVTHGVHCAF